MEGHLNCQGFHFWWLLVVFVLVSCTVLCRNFAHTLSTSCRLVTNSLLSVLISFMIFSGSFSTPLLAHKHFLIYFLCILFFFVLLWFFFSFGLFYFSIFYFFYIGFVFFVSQCFLLCHYLPWNLFCFLFFFHLHVSLPLLS